MAVGDTKDQRFLLTRRVQVFSQLTANCTVKSRDNQTSVKICDLKILIVCQHVVDHFTLRIQTFHLFTFSQIHTILGIAGSDFNRWILIDEITVDHGGTVGIAINRFAEDIDCVYGRSGGQGNFYGIEMIENTTVGRNIIQLTTELQFAFSLFFIENIATMCFVHHDAIITADRHRFI
ncbi:hypothetical protein D3C80_1284310 [compost metagenome]